MRKYVEKVVPERVSKYLVARICDLCGITSDGESWESESIYHVNETEICVEVRQKEGDNYSDCGHGTRYEIDLCPTCFKKKLVPWLKSQGADINEEEWDW